MAAVGGMAVPALVYTVFNRGGEGAAGWGVPMATDIAFALGVLALLGSRVPLGLKVFVTALAIVDDLGAVLVIAFFYTAQISWTSLGAAAALFAVLLFINKAGARRPLPYVVLGAALWLAVLKSGVHATIAGVLLALTIPARARLNPEEFAAHARSIVGDLERPATSDSMPEDHGSAVQELEILCEKAESPLQRLEHALHPWVGFVIMPIFAFANAGVTLGGNALSLLAHPVSLGVMSGLLVGKIVGIGGLSWLAVRAGWAQLPMGVSSRQLWGASCLCGIGFTMSLFIANLAFGNGALLDVAKTAILFASLIAGVLGYVLLRQAPSPPP